MLKMAELAMPMEARVINILVICGKLKERVVELNASPPRKSGSHPRAKIIRALVDQEWNDSIM